MSKSLTFCEIVSAKLLTDWFSVSPTFPEVTSWSLALADLFDSASENKTKEICFCALVSASPFAFRVALRFAF